MAEGNRFIGLFHITARTPENPDTAQTLIKENMATLMIMDSVGKDANVAFQMISINLSNPELASFEILHETYYVTH
jgi:hypothetical protein